MEDQGGILVGLLGLSDGGHAALELLQGSVNTLYGDIGLLHGQAVVDQAGEVKGVGGGVGRGVVELVAVGFGGGEKVVGFVAASDLLGAKVSRCEGIGWGGWIDVRACGQRGSGVAFRS